jgi:hypothetical protein
MSKISLAEQIAAVERAAFATDADGLWAALNTLKLMARYESEVRDLLSLCIKRDEQLPGSRIEVRDGNG